MVESGAEFFREFETKSHGNEETNEGGLLDTSESYSITTAPTSTLPKAPNAHRLSSKVVFNDGTLAGVLNSLKQCTRAMHLHEADVTLKSMGLMLPSPLDITPPRIDSFRSTLMTLYENPGRFFRVLKKENIDVTGSKLNIFVIV